MMKPTIHRNGTSKKELLDQVLNAAHKLRDAMEALAHATPHGRDYYVQDPIEQKLFQTGNTFPAIKVALEEHNARATKLQEVLDDLNELAIHICDSD